MTREVNILNGLQLHVAMATSNTYVSLSCILAHPSVSLSSCSTVRMLQNTQEMHSWVVLLQSKFKCGTLTLVIFCLQSPIIIFHSDTQGVISLYVKDAVKHT